MDRIETVARALATYWHNPWDTMAPGAKAMYLQAAQAAIEADEGAPFAQAFKGFFAGLTEVQQKAALEYQGPDNHGDTANH